MPAIFVLFLRGTDGKRKWVFKSEAGEGPPKHMVSQGGRAVREHLASLFNSHQLFPIPPTFYVEYKGEIGSIQQFIEGQRIADVEESVELSEGSQEEVPENVEGGQSSGTVAAPSLKVDQSDLQRIVVFDILFHNTDRNADNFIAVFDDSRSLYNLKGIDHGECLGDRREGFYPVETNPHGLLEESINVDSTIVDTILKDDEIKGCRKLIQNRVQSGKIKEIALKRFELTSELLQGAFSEYGEKLSFFVIVNEFAKLQTEHSDKFLQMDDGFKPKCIEEFMERLSNVLKTGEK